MELNDGGVLELEEYSKDEIDSLNQFFHWKMEDYEIFHNYMLEVEEAKQGLRRSMGNTRMGRPV